MKPDETKARQDDTLTWAERFRLLEPWQRTYEKKAPRLDIYEPKRLIPDEALLED